MNKQNLSMDPRASMEVTDLAVEIRERHKVVENHYKDWDAEAKEDYDFALGNQWTPEDRQILQEAGRPCLTFNRIRPLINIVSGYQRENSSRIKVNPDGGEDRIFSEVMDRLLTAVAKWSVLPHKEGYLFDDGCYCGKGFLEAVIDYNKDPIRGQLDFKQRSPYQIRPDPDCIDYDINDNAKYCFKYVRLRKSELKDLYPKKKYLIDGFVMDNDDAEQNGDGLLVEEAKAAGAQDDDYGNRSARASQTVLAGAAGAGHGLPQDTCFTVKEYWRTKLVEKWFVISTETQEPERFDTEDEAKTFAAKQGEGIEPIMRKVNVMWCAAYVCGHVVQDEISTFEPYYSGFPFFRVLADWAPNASNERLRVQGVTRPLKDPQREKNKAKSQYLHILNTQSNSGWVGDEDALSDAGWKALEKMGSKPGITVKKKRGTELREIQPKGPNNGHMAREEKADEEFKQISNINPDLLGLQDATASGRAIGMRIKQAVLSLARLFSNYRYTKEIMGNFILAMIPMLFDLRKAKKVLGPDYMKKAVDSEKYPNGLTDGHISAFLQMVKDRKYDVFVTEADSNATIRYEIFQELSELIKAGAPIPIDLVVDYMDLPNAEEVKKRIREAQAQAAAAAQAGVKQ